MWAALWNRARISTPRAVTSLLLVRPGHEKPTTIPPTSTPTNMASILSCTANGGGISTPCQTDKNGWQPTPAKLAGAIAAVAAQHLGAVAVQERVLVRRIDGFKLLRHRLAEIFFAQLVPQAQTLPLWFSEDLLVVGEERVRQKHRGHLFTETIPHPQAPTLSASTAAPAIFKKRDLWQPDACVVILLTMYLCASQHRDESARDPGSPSDSRRGN